MENSYLIDWLSFTVPVADVRDLKTNVVREFVTDILGLRFTFEERLKGRYGYTRSLVFSDCIAILYNDFSDLEFASDERLEQAASMGFHVEMTGQGCRHFEEVCGSDWVQFFTLLSGFDVRYSRLDIALDDYEGMLDFGMIERKVKAGDVISLSRKRDITESVEVSQQEKFDNNGNSKGKTIYFGTRSSSIYIRFYDKKKEQEGKGKEVEADLWQRYEIVLKKEKAEDFISRYCNGEQFEKLYLGVLSGAIRFVDRGEDTNKARWNVSRFWQEFLKGAEAIKLQSHEVTPSIDKTIDWIETSVLGSIKLLDMVANELGMDLYEILEKAPKNISERHEGILNEFKVLSKEQKDVTSSRLNLLGVGMKR